MGVHRSSVAKSTFTTGSFSRWIRQGRYTTCIDSTEAVVPESATIIDPNDQKERISFRHCVSVCVSCFWLYLYVRKKKEEKF